MVLFPVVGNPLHAKYSGPELLLDIRKHKCVIPELVILNNKLGLENPTHSESCVALETEKEEDTESEVRLGNDQQSIKLQNSLNDFLKTFK